MAFIIIYFIIGLTTFLVDNYFITNFLVPRYEKEWQKKLEMISAKVFVVIFWPIWIYKRQKNK
jgi:hypothetical protein